MNANINEIVKEILNEPFPIKDIEKLRYYTKALTTAHRMPLEAPRLPAGKTLGSSP